MFPVSDVIPSRSRPVVTIGLIVLTSLVFLYQLQLDRSQMYALAHGFGVVPSDFHWGSLVTSLFIHDGWIHVGGNMLYLWIFGDNVEDTLGHTAYLGFYVAAGLIAAVAHIALHPMSSAPLIGASSAISGVMGAYFVLYPRSQVLTAIFLVRILDLIEVPALFFLGMWLPMQMLSGLASMGAESADIGDALPAHLAGFGTGAIVGFVLRRRGRAWSDGN
jgi:membrane associated rhomboid family serine protease